MRIRCMNCMKVYDSTEKACPHCGFVRGTVPREAYHLFPGVMLSERYVIGTVVAYGGFGILYRAWDTKLENTVAIKEYFPTSYVNRNPGEEKIFVYASKKQGEFEKGLRGFLEEARATARFAGNDNIVSVHDYFQQNGTAYMVMEFMTGMTLKQYIKKNGGTIPWQEAVSISCAVMEIMKVVHGEGILHRDIAPDNIMLCDDGKVKLFDFGAARLPEAQDSSKPVTLKIGYAPPEQYNQKAAQGPYTDVYALGATIYKAITGVLPEESVNRREALEHREPDSLKPPRSYVPDLPQHVDVALLRAMAIQPEMRFQSMQEFQDAILNRKHYEYLEKELKKRKLRRTVGIAAACVALAAAAAGVFAYTGRKREETMLGKCTLEVYAGPQYMAELLEEASAGFMKDYPDVKLEFTYDDPEDRDAFDSLKDSLKSGKGPEVYLSYGNDELLKYAMPLDGVYKEIGENSGDYVFLSPENRDSGKKELPLGMTVTVLYALTPQIRAGAELPAQNGGTVLFAGESCPAIVSDTVQYDGIKSAHIGKYVVAPVGDEDPSVAFGESYAVSDSASRLEKLAAERLLSYLILEDAQNVLHCREQNDSYMPVNRDSYRQYAEEVRLELSFLKDLPEEGEHVYFVGSGELAEEENSIYNALFVDESGALRADAAERLSEITGVKAE